MKALNKFLVFAIIISMTTVLAACSSSGSGNNSGSEPAPSSSNGEAKTQEMETSVTFGTHPQGLAQYTVGSVFASIVGTHTPIAATASPFAGPAAWMPLLNKGDIDFGILSTIDINWAWNGINDYEKNSNLRLFFRLGEPEQVPISVRQDSGIQSVADLKGKRVPSQFSGNLSIHNIIESSLAAAGVAWADVREVPVADVNSAIKGLREGQLDATFGPSPTSASAQETHAMTPLKILNFGDVPPDQINNFPEQAMKELTSRLPGAKPIVAKIGIMEEEATIITYPFLVAASAHLSEAAGYEIMKTIWENHTEAQPGHPWLKKFTPEIIFYPDFDVPYHDGAVKFFKEQGVWTDEAEARQQDLLK